MSLCTFFHKWGKWTDKVRVEWTQQATYFCVITTPVEHKAGTYQQRTCERCNLVEQRIVPDEDLLS